MPRRPSRAGAAPLPPACLEAVPGRGRYPIPEAWVRPDRKPNAGRRLGDVSAAPDARLRLLGFGIPPDPAVNLPQSSGTLHRAGTPSMTRPRRPRGPSVQSPLETYLREINETPLL